MRAFPTVTLIASILYMGACRHRGDGDGDGYGTLSPADCNDEDVEVHPGATEVCNGVDDDCSGMIDDGATDAVTTYRDADGDGHGTLATPAVGCEPAEGFVESSDDCDDLDATVFTGATDDDCTDTVDRNCDGSVGFADADADTFPACKDCDDSLEGINPAAIEVCDGVDNNCDGVSDEADAEGELTWYADADVDGQGDLNDSKAGCVAPEGYVGNANDCNDTDPDAFVGAPESCNAADDNCNGVIDDNAVNPPTWYHDGDLDGHGSLGLTQVACTQPTGFVESSDDCNDIEATVYPGASETDCADPVDRNCDQVVGFADTDGDGFAACQDCDDTRAAVNPNRTEACDALDNDCDGAIDETGATGESLWFADSDGDGQGKSTATLLACGNPEGYVNNSTDCNDSKVLVYVGATESCNDVDDDCDGLVDDQVATAPTWYHDGDLDGHGKGLSAVACRAPTGFVSSNDDCNDVNATAYPGGTEVCDDVDNDCDATIDEGFNKTWYLDYDEDTYGKTRLTVVNCVQPLGFVTRGGDCNDLSAEVFPTADEVCNNIDDDCNGAIDEADARLLDGRQWYVDADNDSFGDSAKPAILDCDPVANRVVDGTDCDDTTDLVSPAETEIPANAIDDNCDSNDAPGAPGLVFSPTAPAPAQALQCKVATPSSDSDGDVVTYTFAWKKNGSPWIGAVSTTTLAGDTIPASITAAGESWTCTATPFDGFEVGKDAVISVTPAAPAGGCGPNMHVDPVQLTPGWLMCYVEGADALAIRNAACNTLFDSTGKQFGCWHGTCQYPHLNCNSIQTMSCTPNIQNTTTYSAWGGTAHVLGVCIKQ